MRKLILISNLLKPHSAVFLASVLLQGPALLAQVKPPPRLTPLSRMFTTDTGSVSATAVRNLAGFRSNTLAANDDGSTAAVALGFLADFFGASTTTVYVNNNGNVTFTNRLEQYTPNGLAIGVGQPIIAPYFADVDTRGAGSGLVTYGSAIITDAAEGWVNRQAFGVEWPAVGYYGYHVGKVNTFELVLVDRSDTGVGNFDIELNYNSIQWETGDASGGSGGIGGVSAVVGYSNGLSGSANVFFQLPGSLVDGALINGGTNALTSNSRNSTVLGRYYFQVRNGTVVSSIALLDPITQLVNSAGNGIISDPTNSALTSNRLITRVGVSADGVSKLVVRFSVSSPGMVTFSLVDAGGNALPPNPEENGTLTDLQGSPLDGLRSVPTVSNTGQKAFAIYMAPTAFVRQSNSATDLSASSRQVFLQAVFSGGGSPLITPLLIVRPPVVLVHGIWASESSWNNFPLTSSVACEDSGHFYACRINYAWINDAKFAVIAPNVGQRIRNDVAKFRSAKNVAAVQADAIAHSLGGDIIRTLPLCGAAFQDCAFQYDSPANLGAGDIHELVTIGTPHLGTPLANQMIQYQNQACPFWQGTLATNFADQQHVITNGAVEDLQANTPGGAISSINSAPSPFPLSYIVGVSSSNDESLVNAGLVAEIRKCSSNILPASIRTLFGSDSDLVVPALSQRNNLEDGALGTTSSTSVQDAGYVIHSAAVVLAGQTGFSSDELNSLPSGASAQLAALGKAILSILDNGPFAH